MLIRVWDISVSVQRFQLSLLHEKKKADNFYLSRLKWGEAEIKVSVGIETRKSLKVVG